MEEEAKRFGNFFSAFSRLLFGKNPSESRIAYPLFARKKGEPRVASAVFRGLESAYVVFYSEYRAMRLGTWSFSLRFSFDTFTRHRDKSCEFLRVKSFTGKCTKEDLTFFCAQKELTNSDDVTQIQHCILCNAATKQLITSVPNGSRD